VTDVSEVFTASIITCHDLRRKNFRNVGQYLPDYTAQKTATFIVVVVRT
jgi:hypothetical protein